LGLLLMLATSAGSGDTAPRRSTPEGSHAQELQTTPGTRGHEGTIHLNFRNVDVLQLITMMSELTGKNFLVDDKVQGTITLIAPQPVTLEEAYQIFLAALKMHGLTVVPQGPISKIIPSRDVKTRPLPTMTDPTPPPR
jgi:general secretion pathway protein D